MGTRGGRAYMRGSAATSNQRGGVVRVIHRVDHAMSGRGAFALCDDIADLALRRGSVLVLDLGAVEALDASGVVALVRVYTGCTRKQIALSLFDVRASVRETLARTGLTSLVAVYEPAPVATPAHLQLALAQGS